MVKKIVFLLAVLTFSAVLIEWPMVAQTEVAKAEKQPLYETRQQHDPNGIGKFYMGREIAHVMGHQGAEWLDRPEREQEEQPTIMINALGLKPGDVVADIGAGTGYLSFRMAEKVGPKGKVMATDIQQEMLDILKQRMKERKVTNIEPVLGTIKDTGLKPESVDLILLVDVYHEFDHPYEMAASMARALKPGGRLVFVEYRLEDPTVPIKTVHKMSQQQVIKEMTPHPLRWLKTSTVLPRQHIIFFEKTAMTKQTSGNPIFPGWYADPEVAVFGNKYWIYPTYSAPYDEQTFLDAFSSSDLVNWTKHPRITDNNEVKWVRRAMWAPAIIEKDGKYYLFFAGNDIQNDNETGGIGVAVSDNPAGPFKDYLGRPLLDKIHNRAQPIDQYVFRDKDGQYYMVYGGWGRCNITKLKSDFTGFLPFEDGTIFKEITPKGYVEGPTMFVRNGKYYFMWSEGGWGGPNYRVAYAIADSPMGPFERIDTILQQDATVATGAGHHSVLQIPGKDEWYIIYHRRPLGETDANHRVTCIDRMYFDEKGFIKPVKITFDGVEKLK